MRGENLLRLDPPLLLSQTNLDFCLVVLVTSLNRWIFWKAFLCQIGFSFSFDIFHYSYSKLLKPKDTRQSSELGLIRWCLWCIILPSLPHYADILVLVKCVTNTCHSSDRVHSACHLNIEILTSYQMLPKKPSNFQYLKFNILILSSPQNSFHCWHKV